MNRRANASIVTAKKEKPWPRNAMSVERARSAETTCPTPTTRQECGSFQTCRRFTWKSTESDKHCVCAPSAFVRTAFASPPDRSFTSNHKKRGIRTGRIPHHSLATKTGVDGKAVRQPSSQRMKSANQRTARQPYSIPASTGLSTLLEPWTSFFCA